MVEIRKSTCRICGGYCPVNVYVDGDRVIKVEGNAEAPLYEGFICPKGRALEATHNDPNRLKNCLKRLPDGNYKTISSQQLVAEVSDRLREILDRHGPNSVASFMGTPVNEQQATAAMIPSFLAAIGSTSFFTTATIDQPGIYIADALHGTWDGGRTIPENLDMFMIVGGNPVISKQYLAQNPGKQLKRMVKSGTKLIVIDPRKTETARRADIHLQCIPGEDPTILAGLINLVIKNDDIHKKFIELNTSGFDDLAEIVSEFTPEYVADRTGINKQDLIETARIIGNSSTGDIATGVGPSMSGRGTLATYLTRCLQTIRGFWAQEGERGRGAVLMPHKVLRAQPNPPRQAWGYGRKMRIRGLQETAAGLPVGALPEEILTPGDGQIRAVFMHHGAMTAWPNPELTKRALESLDLLIVHDIELSATSRLADYVIATKLEFETPVMSQFQEVVFRMHPGYGWVEPYGAYQPAILEPPKDADVMESWEIYYRVAKKLGLKLKYGGLLDNPGTEVELDMGTEPTTDDLYEILCRNSMVPLSEVKKYPNGHVFEEAKVHVEPREPGCTARLDLAHPEMMKQLVDVRTEAYMKKRGVTKKFPYLYIPRRIQNTTNGAYRAEGLLKTKYNPAFMHSSDLEQLSLKPGEMVQISSRFGSIIGFVERDDALRKGVLSMCHGFGKNPGESSDPYIDGSNVNHLLSWEYDFDQYNGMPRMGAVPVAVKKL